MNNDIEATKRVYEQVIEIRNFEIKELVQRNNFFMIFQGVLLASALQSSASKNFYTLWIFIAGLFISILQACISAGAKYWQQHWEIKLRDTEANLLSLLNEKNKQIELFPDDAEQYRENFYSLFQELTTKEVEEISKSLSKKPFFIKKLILKKPSVSTIPIYVPFVLTIIWLLLILTCLIEILTTKQITFSTFPIVTEIKFKK